MGEAAPARDVLHRGREAFERREWSEAYSQLASAARERPLEPDDLNRLATAAYLLGQDTESVELWSRAHHGFLSRGGAPLAARCAFWLGMTLMMRGEMAPGGGWLGRAQQILEDAGIDCVERGYLLVPAALQSIEQGDPATAQATFAQAEELARHFGDQDLVALAQLGRGQSLIELGNLSAGVGLLDQAMVGVTAGDVSPIPAGIIYCAVILECQKVHDLRRAQEWTTALTRWCDSQPDLVPYRGQCLVHRSEIMQLRGAWKDAFDEARRACERLSQPPQPAVGMAYYQLGELHRLRGELTKAEEAYRQANQRGRNPQPGMALLRLAQERIDAAARTIRQVADETQDPTGRSKVLPAYVEIMLAAGDLDAARLGADELAEIAADVDAPLLHTLAAQARAAVLLAKGDARSACDALSRARTAWEELEAPYEAARVRVLMADARRRLGDSDTADLELDAARRVFREVGAGPDLARLERLSGRVPATSTDGLTRREIEVLGLVAAGKTNRQIADELVISEKTVARHISNIFTKLGVPTRAAATAYAYQHDLVGHT